MGRTFEVSGDSIVKYLLYLPTTLAVVALTFAMPKEFGNLPLVVLFGGLTLATIVAVWREWAGKELERPKTAEDITYDPFAYPGDMARHNWAKAVRRLPGWEEDDD